ncbi:MAG: hypothetical protein HZB16_12000 [Armatimonadetes bacterium]|nr:hypothetical protein [Armatimonadota bacterium]
MRTCRLLRLLTAALLLALAPLAAQDLTAGFADPPRAAKPQTWWHWMNGNITAAGLTKDIEEMRKVGLGGAQIFNVDDGIPAGRVNYLSPEWIKLFRHAISEADRNGLEMCFHNCAGWSSSGGPWVTPAEGMQKLVWTEAHLVGPGRPKAPLAQPQKVQNHYVPIAVLAFPTPRAEQHSLAEAKPTVTVTPAPATAVDFARLTDGNNGTAVTLAKPAAGTELALTFAFAAPFAARSLTIQGGPGRQAHRGVLEASDDGTNFRRVDVFAISAEGGRASTTFAAARAKVWRVRFTGFDSRARAVALAEVDLSGAARIDDWPRKAGFDRADNQPPAAGPEVDADARLDRAQMIDLSDKCAADGTLDWDAPTGDWTILRLGHTCTGKDNHPSPEPGRGLEVDKLSYEAVTSFWDKGVKPILDACEPFVGKSLTQTLIDSYEVGFQTWTPKFAAEFTKRRGYDPKLYLPAMTGRVVDSLAVSERFLWDVRRTLGELFDENYYGRFAELAAQRGMSLAAEPYGNGNFDGLTAGGYATLPMTEFWSGSGGDEFGGKLAGSIAHTYGRSVVGAESFTASPENGAWRNDPWSIKALGDRMWCAGVSRFIFHRYAHQPWTDLKPGMTMSRWGMHFEWPITWWEQAPAWTKYLARGQFLLQSGVYAADALVFVGDNSPNNAVGRGTLPAGYDYDCADPTILGRLKVADGQLTLPHGSRYRVLVLPESDTMLPESLAKVQALLEAGATVVGPKPSRSPSLKPGSDAEVQKLASAVWGDLDGKTKTQRAVGRGTLVWGKPLAAVLTDMKLSPDLEFAGPEAGSMRWLHRRAGNQEIYFLASWSDRSHELSATFRVGNLLPELFHADTGVIEPAPLWQRVDGRTRVTLPFEGRGSVFVVFRKPLGGAVGVASVARTGEAMTAPGVEAAKPDELIIDSARYGVFPEAGDRVDVTEKVRAMVAAGQRAIPATNAMAGSDPANQVVKSLKVVYTLNGQQKTVVVEENSNLEVPAGATVEKAVYGLVEGEEPQAQFVDVTKILNDAVKNGRLQLQCGNDLAGDPANMTVKETRVEYRLNGVRRSARVAENAVLTLPASSGGATLLPEPYDLAIGANGRPRLTAWAPGAFEFGLSGGKTAKLDIATGPRQAAVPGPWKLSFPPNWGAPASVTLDKLISWTEHTEAGVRYFSGTAEYQRNLDVPADWVGANRRLVLDLGRVVNFAELFVNGKSQGVLWKPPFRYDLTGVAKAGSNDIRVRVTNLWPNRLIGDEQIDDGRQWGGDGRLLAWPQWILDGKPKPNDGRYTWTTWRHYTKDSELLPSGMLGPVVLRSGVVAEVK